MTTDVHVNIQQISSPAISSEIYFANIFKTLSKYPFCNTLQLILNTNWRLNNYLATQLIAFWQYHDWLTNFHITFQKFLVHTGQILFTIKRVACLHFANSANWGRHDKTIDCSTCIVKSTRSHHILSNYVTFTSSGGQKVFYWWCGGSFICIFLT